MAQAKAGALQQISLALNTLTASLQVVHHPTIIAMHGEGESWSFAADADVRAKFWGRSVELSPVGLIRLKFDDGDEYNWAKVSKENDQVKLRMFCMERK